MYPSTPEYLLDTLDSPTGVMDSTQESQFKREVDLAKKYLQKVNWSDDAASTTLAAGTTEPEKLAEWLFDRRIVDDLLKQSSCAAKSLFENSSDFSLPLRYLRKTMATLQSSLHYRSPFSCIYDSLNSIKSNEPIVDIFIENTNEAKALKGYNYNKIT